MLVGDFNGWPGTPVYQLAKEGYLNDQSMSELQAQDCITLPDGQVLNSFKQFCFFTLLKYKFTEVILILHLS